jgi:hypothetical protein
MPAVGVLPAHEAIIALANLAAEIQRRAACGRPTWLSGRRGREGWGIGAASEARSVPRAKGSPSLIATRNGLHSSHHLCKTATAGFPTGNQDVFFQNP